MVGTIAIGATRVRQCYLKAFEYSLKGFEHEYGKSQTEIFRKYLWTIIFYGKNVEKKKGENH
jgi:hypothetical protein